MKSFINRRSLAILLAFTFSAGPEIEVTATFETLLLKVLRTDVALAEFGQFALLLRTSQPLRNGLFFLRQSMKPYPSFKISGRSV